MCMHVLNTENKALIFHMYILCSGLPWSGKKFRAFHFQSGKFRKNSQVKVRDFYHFPKTFFYS